MTLLKRDFEGTKQLSYSFATTMAATYALKYSINAERPNGKSLSMPSGHTAAAFAGAGFIQRRYGWGYGLPAYALASYVGWSRVNSHQHHVGDVMVGATLGVLSNIVFTTPFKDTAVGVDADSRGAVLSVTKRF